MSKSTRFIKEIIPLEVCLNQVAERLLMNNVERGRE